MPRLLVDDGVPPNMIATSWATRRSQRRCSSIPHHTDDESRIFNALTDESRERSSSDDDGFTLAPTQVADYLLTLVDAAARWSRFCWWAILGLNQWPLPCQGSALPLS
jgi:hypothetical protein